LISMVLPDKSIASLPEFLNTVSLIEPSQKSQSKESNNALLKLVFLIENFDLIIFK
jgi:hypothetical protein